ncbi:MAG: lysylphosphatidylglycerol synthase transmembrane domain-containing protein [Candidatus Berkelbacteria bacterium]|nr:lysylphosphatidylglycerol synthase transmembrane domain-containing protein [Candidatus Berkelbacteria bacterium]
MAKKNKVFFYRALLLIVSIVFIVILFKQFGTIQKAIEVFSQGSWYFIFAIIAIQVLGIVNKGAFYQTLYDYFGAKDSLKRLITLSLAANFINLAAPTAGLSGMAIFISEAKRHGMSKSRATFVNVFAYFIYYAVFLLILLFGLFYLLFNHQLYQYQIATAAILFGMILIIFIIMIAAFEEAARLEKVFELIATATNFFTRFLRRGENLIKKSDVRLLSFEINESLKIIRKKFRGLWLPVFHVFLIEIIDLLTLYYLFLAFRFPIYPGVLITVYAIGILFTLVSITPGGIGVVEATMILVLTNLKVPVELATIVVFAYRIIAYWLPFGAGYFAFRSFQSEKINQLQDGSR